MNGQTHLHTVPHVRFWQHGQIALTAKTRVESLVKNNREGDAKSMGEEWLTR